MEWATAQFFFFFSLSHNTTNCIVIGKAGRQRAGARHNTAQQATIRPLLSHDTARWPAIRPGTRETRRAVRAVGSRVTIQRFVSWLRGRLWVTIRLHYVAIQHSSAPRYGAGRLATRRRSCDTASSDTRGGAATRAGERRHARGSGDTRGGAATRAGERRHARGSGDTRGRAATRARERRHNARSQACDTAGHKP